MLHHWGLVVARNYAIPPGNVWQVIHENRIPELAFLLKLSAQLAGRLSP